jgi:hypothetical protein
MFLCQNKYITYFIITWRCAVNRKVAGSFLDGDTKFIFFEITFWPQYGTGIDSASNINENQKYFLGGKGGQCVGIKNLPLSFAECLEICKPPPPGMLWACNWPVHGSLHLLYFLLYLADTEICPYVSLIKFKLWLHHMVEFLHEIGFTKLRMFLSIRFEEIIASV